MFCLSIHIGQVVWQMMYKSEDSVHAADSILASAHNSSFSVPGPITIISDDFGQIAHVSLAALHGWLVEDLDLSKLAHVEKGLHNARTQNDYVKRVMADPSAQPRQQMGPGVLSPMGNGILRQ
jgi:hypothetical protein